MDPYSAVGDGQATQPQYCRRFVSYMLSFTQRRLVLIIVFVALLLDNILLTVIVPIIPEYLWNLEHADDIRELCSNMSLHRDTHWRTMLGRKYFLSPDLLRTNTSASCLQNIMDHNRSTAIQSETLKIGFMFASKPFVQLIFNPMVGPLTNKIGYTIPMFSGFVVLFLSTLVFAYANSYMLLFLARSFQGIGSACSSVAGMGMLATFYPDDKERGEAFGFALSGLALGVLIGPSFGGIMYEYSTKETPFIVLAIFVFMDGVLQLIILRPQYNPEPQKGTPLKELLADPYIILAAAAITIGNLSMAVLEPSLPSWIKRTMNASRLEQGIVFLPFSISYLLSTNVIGGLGHRIGRWLTTLVGLLLISIFMFIIPSAASIQDLIFPGIVIGFALGMVDCSVLPIMGYLVDIRHVSVYGSVYAIADVAFCIGFVIVADVASRTIFVSALVCLVFTPFVIFLREPPAVYRDKSEYIKDTCPEQYMLNAFNGLNEPVGDGATPGAIMSNDYGYGED